MTAAFVEDSPDAVRMQRDRSARLHDAMAVQDVETLILLGNSNVAYATGARWPLADPGRANVERPVAVVRADDPVPHLFTSSDTRVVANTHRHGQVYVELDEGAAAFGAALATMGSLGRVAIDELPGSLSRTVFTTGVPASADDVVGAAKLIKTPDELGALRIALRITEEAIADVQTLLAPGLRQTALTARFLHRIFELGADANILDPIWQVMPMRLADGPWTTHGDIACPLLTTERELVEGDVLWVDVGISYQGFASDFGRTWVVGRAPTRQQQAQFQQWRDIIESVLAVTKPGATGADLTAAARAVAWDRKPWMEHFYLGHGLGVDSAEPPYIGTDIGEAYDARNVLLPGMVVVLEPLVWEDGAGGYRAEEVVAITEDGYVSMTDYPYDPYEY